MTEIWIRWTKTAQPPTGEAGEEESADLTLYEDGRVRVGRRLAGGEPIQARLSEEELASLRRWVLDELCLPEIDGETLAREVRAAAARRKASASSEAAEWLATPQKDAGTTILRLADGGRTHEIRYYDLFGDAREHPEVEALQRLRRFELRMLELAEELARRGR